ncbi:S6 family peptidase [Streptobacillus canis]|uniref:S6 family peptidase n=1 Tax=Streptobacillus canis TaxID=2678686 RepID=UPI0012E1C2F7|nr:S6 family peptidase [Streptobacillus canis]
MKNYKLKLLLLATLLGELGFSGLARHDINWSDYEDFGMNNGKYVKGRTGIIVYKKDGSISGVIDNPMPNFDGVPNGTGGGGAGMWDDPQILTTVTHIVNPRGKRADLGFNFLGRHMRKDVNLYKNYKNNISKNKVNDEVIKFSETSRTKHHIDVGGDFSFVRLDKINHDAITYNTLNYDDYKNKVNREDLIARVGFGSNSVFTENGEYIKAADDFRVAGGLNKINNKYERNKVENVLDIFLEINPKTPIDIGTMGGDSGSPVFWWDKNEKKWKAIANNSAGIYSNEKGLRIKGSILLNGVQHIEKFKEGITDKSITDVDSVTFNNNILKVGTENRSFDNSDFKNTIMKHRITTDTLNINEAFYKIKNQTFDKQDITINLEGNNDISIARLDFKKDATIQGSGTLKTAGIVIDKNATLTYKANISKGNIVRKIGEGTLKIEGSTQNEGDINIGGNGTLLLNNSGGYAAKNIRVAQGAIVKLMKENQLNENNIYFGLRGGSLDLNSQNISFNDIYHVDNGATITNSNNTKSTFTFNPVDNEERTYLGGFTDNLDIIYNPNNNDSKWHLRGNSDIKGNLDIEKGTVSIGGDVIVHGFDNIVGKDEYSKSKFKSNEINVKSKLEINRAVEVDSKINIENGATLNISALGTVLEDIKSPYENAPSEKDINKITLKNEINFKNNTTPNVNNFTINTENNHTVIIDSKIKGYVKAEKTGSGLLDITSNEENNVNGNLDIKNGKVKINTDNSLKNLNFKLENNSILEVDNISTLSNILPKIDKKSNGVLSLGNDVATIDSKYAEYSTLFLGSSKNINLGSDNLAIDNSITKLNLGGDNGTITLKGLDLSNHITDVNIGDGINKGKVIISKIAEDNNFNIKINKGVDLEIKEKTSSKKLINLGYGSYTAFDNKSLLKENSEGVLFINSSDNNNVSENKTYIGTKKGEDNITLTSLNTGNNEYRLSGDGILNVNFKLEKNLTVDAQYLDGGEIAIKSSNSEYKGNVTIMGNKDGKDEGSITLKLYAENSLGTENIFNIKSGGNLDLNGHDLTLKIGDTDKYGTITNKNNHLSILKIVANDKTTVNNKIIGNGTELEKNTNLDVIKTGSNSIEFTNSENNFNKLSIEEGTLIYKDIDALRDTEVILNPKTKLEATTNEISSHIIADNASIKINKSSTGNTTIKELTLKSDIEITGHRPKPKEIVTYKKLNIGEHNLRINNQTMKFGEVTKTENKKGSVTLVSSNAYLVGEKNKVLNEAISKLTLANSMLMLRDYRSELSDRNNKNHALVEVFGFSTIKNGLFNDTDFNGGGGGANFNNPLLIDENSTLNFENNSLHGRSFIIDSNISGNGKILLRTENGKYTITNRSNFKITSNFKDFKGTLEVTGKDKKNKEHIFQIDDENEEDRTISYKIIGNGKFTNQSEKDIIFKNISEFNGELKAENGGIILSGVNGINTEANFNLINDKDLTLISNEDINVEKALKVNVIDKTDDEKLSKIIKRGNAKIHIENSENIHGLKNVLVESGELSLRKDVLENDEKSKYEINTNAKLTFDITEEKEIKSLISGDGNLEHKGAKLIISSNKLQNSGDIILNNELELNVNNTQDEKTILKGNLKGLKESKLTLLNENNTLEINKDISKFKGTFNLKEANLNLDLENEIVENKIIGTKELKNSNSTTLTLKDISEFNGKVVALHGNLKLDGEKAIKTNATITLNNDKNLILDSEKNLDIDNLKIDVINDNLNESKMIKNGNFKLHIENNENINNLKNVLVENGELSLRNNILVNNGKYEINNNSKLTFDLENDTEITSLIAGNGNLEHKGAKLTIDSSNLKNNGDLILNNELEIKVNENNPILNSTIKGIESSKLTLLNENKVFEINKDISEFLGTFNLKEANLNINIDNGILNNKIIGNKTLSNINKTPLNISNGIIDFTGTIESINGDINLNIDNIPKISKYIISGGNINLNSENNLEFDNQVFENTLNNNKLIKTGNGNVSFTPNNLEGIKNIQIEEGNLTINGNKDSNKIDTSIHLSKDASITLDDNTYIKNLENASEIILVDKNLKIEKYTTIEEGKFNITLNEMNKKLLEIEDSTNDVNIHLNLNSNIVKSIKENGEKLLVGKSNKEVNILNLEKDYETLYGIYSIREGNNIELLSKLTPKTLNSLYTLNELNSLNSIFSKLKFKNSFSMNTLKYKKEDNHFIKFGDTEYKNHLIAHGFESDLEIVNDFKQGKLALGLNYSNLSSSINSQILLNDKVISEDNNIISDSILTKIGYRYNNFELNGAIGYNKVRIIKDNKNLDYADFLKTKLNASYNKEFKINDKLNIIYSNTIGFTYSPMLKENITKIYDSVDVVKNISPFTVFYETGINLNSKYIDTSLKGNFIRNFSNISLSKNNEKIDNLYYDNYKASLDFGLSIKPSNNLALKSDFIYKLNQKNYSNYLLRLGLDFIW